MCGMRCVGCDVWDAICGMRCVVRDVWDAMCGMHSRPSSSLPLLTHAHPDSTKIHTRTGKWLNMTNHLRLHGSSYETVQAFLSHPSILLVGASRVVRAVCRVCMCDM